MKIFRRTKNPKDTNPETEQQNSPSEVFSFWLLLKPLLKIPDEPEGYGIVDLFNYIVRRNPREYRLLVLATVLKTAAFATVPIATGFLIADAATGSISFISSLLYLSPFLAGYGFNYAARTIEKKIKGLVKILSKQFSDDRIEKIKNLDLAEKETELIAIFGQVMQQFPLLLNQIFSELPTRLSSSLFLLPTFFFVNVGAGIAYMASALGYLKYSYKRSRTVGRLRSIELKKQTLLLTSIANYLLNIVAFKFNSRDKIGIKEITKKESEAFATASREAAMYEGSTEQRHLFFHALMQTVIALGVIHLFNKTSLGLGLLATTLTLKEKASISLHQLSGSITRFLDTYSATSSLLQTFEEKMAFLTRESDESIDPAEELNQAPSITIENIAIGRGGKTLISNIWLEILQGKNVVIVGASGAGKSTLLKRIAQGNPNQEKKETGRITFDNQNANQVNIQDSAVYIADLGPGSNTVREFIRTIGGRQITDDVIKGMLIYYSRDPKKIDDALATLSGGENQILATAGASFNDASIGFLDEPAGAVDKSSTQELIAMWNGKCNPYEKATQLEAAATDPRTAERLEATAPYIKAVKTITETLNTTTGHETREIYTAIAANLRATAALEAETASLDAARCLRAAAPYLEAAARNFKNMTLLMTSHNPDTVKKIADRIVIVGQKQVRMVTPKEAFEDSEFKRIFGQGQNPPRPQAAHVAQHLESRFAPQGTLKPGFATHDLPMSPM